MRIPILHRSLTALALTAMIAACSRPPEVIPEATVETNAGEGQIQDEAPPAKPGPDRALQVANFIRLWVATAAGEDDVYEIPERAGNNVEGVLASFHTVHQTEADSYAVCVDFKDGGNTYDVDFFVDETLEGLVVMNHYLHKVNGETVE